MNPLSNAIARELNEHEIALDVDTIQTACSLFRGWGADQDAVSSMYDVFGFDEVEWSLFTREELAAGVVEFAENLSPESAMVTTDAMAAAEIQYEAGKAIAARIAATDPTVCMDDRFNFGDSCTLKQIDVVVVLYTLADCTELRTIHIYDNARTNDSAVEFAINFHGGADLDIQAVIR